MVGDGGRWWGGACNKRKRMRIFMRMEKRWWEFFYFAYKLRFVWKMWNKNFSVLINMWIVILGLLLGYFLYRTNAECHTNWMCFSVIFSFKFLSLKSYCKEKTFYFMKSIAFPPGMCCRIAIVREREGNENFYSFN